LPLCKAIREKLLGPGVKLIYGEAGVGKTTLTLEVLSEACSNRCLYITTERLDFLRRAAGMDIDLGRLIVYEAFDAEDFLEVVTHRQLPFYDAVAVDSINSYAHEGRAAYALTALLASMLYSVSERYGLLVVETAQVRWKPGEGVIPASLHAIGLWADTLIELTRREGGTRAARVDGETYLYRITGEGVKWLNC